MGITKIESRYESAFAKMLDYIITNLEYYNFVLSGEECKKEVKRYYLDETNTLCRLFDSMFNCKTYYTCHGEIVTFLFVTRNGKKEKYFIRYQNTF